jgi:SAM-dependent methyltransferase
MIESRLRWGGVRTQGRQTMANVSCVVFAVKYLNETEVTEKRIIEVGSYDVAGSLRPIIESWKPAEYIGIDIEMGPGVDIVLEADEITKEFGKESFDVVISTEVLEHVRDWRDVISNIKNACKPNGIMVISTRSFGYGYHAYPYDFWRYELEDMKEIFSDCEILALENDSQSPGVFIKARKPTGFVERDLSDYELYSIVVKKRCRDVTDKDLRNFNLVRSLVKEKLINVSKNALKLLTGGAYRIVLIRESPAHERTLARHPWEWME